MELSDGILQIETFLTVTLGIVVLFVGRRLNDAISVLREFSIPEPVTGGLLFSVLFGIFYAFSGIAVEFNLAARNILLVYFFTTIGINASLRDLLAGGKPLVIRAIDSAFSGSLLVLTGPEKAGTKQGQSPGSEAMFPPLSLIDLFLSWITLSLCRFSRDYEMRAQLTILLALLLAVTGVDEVSAQPIKQVIMEDAVLPRVAVRPDGRPFVIYRTTGVPRLGVYSCNNPECSSGTSREFGEPRLGDSALTIRPDGRPFFVMSDRDDNLPILA